MLNLTIKTTSWVLTTHWNQNLEQHHISVFIWSTSKAGFISSCIQTLGLTYQAYLCFLLLIIQCDSHDDDYHVLWIVHYQFHFSYPLLLFPFISSSIPEYLQWSFNKLSTLKFIIMLFGGIYRQIGASIEWRDVYSLSLSQRPQVEEHLKMTTRTWIRLLRRKMRRSQLFRLLSKTWMKRLFTFGCFWVSLMNILQQLIRRFLSCQALPCLWN